MAQVTKEMSIAEVLRLNEGTVPIFLSYGMHCLGCPMATSESIGDAGAAHGVDVDQLVTELNEFIAAAG